MKISVLALSVLGLAAFTASAEANPQESRLASLARSFDELYGTSGNDNNSVAFVLKSLPARGLDPKAAVLEPEATSLALAECVFVTEGAYGAHITPEIQGQIVEQFLSAIQSLAKETAETVVFLRSEQLLADSDTLGAPDCSVLVEMGGTRTLALNARVMD